MLDKLSLYDSSEPEGISLPFTIEFKEMSMDLFDPNDMLNLVVETEKGAILLAHCLARVMSAAMFVRFIQELAKILDVSQSAAPAPESKQEPRKSSDDNDSFLHINLN